MFCLFSKKIYVSVKTVFLIASCAFTSFLITLAQRQYYDTQSRPEDFRDLSSKYTVEGFIRK